MQARGPLTVAAYMHLALYHPDAGYYARAARRSGRAGDFFTSVDVGAVFGELLAIQVAEMATAIDGPFDLVEVGAGSGRLAADLLRALRVHAPAAFARTRLHLVDASPTARAAQAETLGDVADRLASSGDALPASISGLVYANELIDAFPVHQVVVREGRLREVFVVASGDGLALREAAPSTPELAEYLRRAGVTLQEGQRAEINLQAVSWMRDVATRLTSGFILLIDYGHRAETLYAPSRLHGTLTTYRGHTAVTPGEAPPDAPAWLDDPGEQDITSHVDFTTLERTALAEGLDRLGLLDQTYLVLNLVQAAPAVLARSDLPFKTRMALKTLLLPGGMGSTFKVLGLSKHVSAARLSGFAAGGRLT